MPISDYRKHLFQLAVRAESPYAAENHDVTGLGHFIGIHSTLELPDPKYAWKEGYGLASTARAGNARSWPLMFYGKQEFSGNFPQITLLAGHIFPFALGTETAVETGSPPYILHTISEAEILPSFTMEARLQNVNDSYGDLVRRWIGCKIDGITFSCAQRGYLTASIDRLYAKNMTHNVGAVADTAAERAYLKYDGTNITEGEFIDYPFSGGRDPYLFSEGSVEILDGGNLLTNDDVISPLRRIVQFSLSIDNNLTPQYYENTSDSNPSTDEFQTPYEFWEGKREYNLKLVADVTNHDFYKFLLFQGRYGQERRGLGIRIRFNKRQGILNNNYIEFRIPGDDASHSWDSALTATNPVTGENNANIHLGAFVEAGAHSITDNNRIRVTLNIKVPSVTIVVGDQFGRYLDI